MKIIYLLIFLLPTTSYAYTFIGSVVSSDNKNSMSFFKFKETVFSLKESWKIDGWEITSIQYRQITLCKDGQCTTLRPGDDSTSFYTFPQEDQVSVEEDTIRVSRSYKNYIINRELDKILMQAASRVVYNEGRVYGLELYDIDHSSIYEVFGLQNGDIISGLEGVPISNITETIKQLKELENADSLEFTIIRDGMEKTLKVELTDDY